MEAVIGLVIAQYDIDIGRAQKAIERNKSLVKQVRDKIETVFTEAHT